MRLIYSDDRRINYMSNNGSVDRTYSILDCDFVINEIYNSNKSFA